MVALWMFTAMATVHYRYDSKEYTELKAVHRGLDALLGAM